MAADCAVRSLAGESDALGAASACADQTIPALVCDWKFQGAPATNPSKSCG